MIGKKMKEIIENSEYGQSEIAGLLKISVPTLRRIYSRESVDLDILLRFCTIFELKPSYFNEALEGVEVSNYKEEKEIKEETNWKEKYFESQKEVSSLRYELKEVRARLDKITDALTEKFLGLELGKHKASSKTATLPKNEKLNLFSLNF